MKDRPRYYKIVRRLASPVRKGTGLFSMYAQKGLRKRYHEGRWNFARLRYLLKGYGFLVYTNSHDAIMTAEDSMMSRTLEVWEVQILGEIKLPKLRLDIGNPDGSYITEENLQKLLKGDQVVESRYSWPFSTVMCTGVKLLQEVMV